MKVIEKLESKTVYQNKWMTVKEDRVRFPSGKEGLYSKVEKDHFVVVVPYENEGVYLVSQYRYAVGVRCWEFPQGSWEESPGTNPEKIAKGELREETGLIPEILIEIGFQYLATGYSNQGYYIFFAQNFTQSDPELEETEQDLACKYFTISEVEQMILNGEIKDATTVNAFSLAKLKGHIK